MFALDHLAFPCFDVDGTVRFYTEVLGGDLRSARSGPAPSWNAKEYLLLVFELPGGVLLDFFSFDGIERPAGGSLPRDIWHVALAVKSRDEVLGLRDRLASAAVPLWMETHDVDDVHVYATDPNGITLEILSTTDSVRRQPAEPAEARQVVERWRRARA